ncbi:MAG: iron ABC transporter permease [Slackia sp.]|nr:iron ABC transporter permease [Slackia sp.]
MKRRSGGAEAFSPRGLSTAAFAVASVVLLTVLGVSAFLIGSSSVSLAEFVAWVSGAEVSDAAKSILANVRLPRVLAALLSGAALAVAGAIIQAVLDNPLASPNVIGVNSGAGLFVLVAAALLPHALWAAPFAAFAGALATSAMIFGISLGAGVSRLTVVLSGIAITTVFGAGMNVVMIVAPDAYIGSSVFLAGGLSGVLLDDLAWPAILIAVGLTAAMLGAHRLNVVALGDDMACALGLNVRMVRLSMLVVASLLAGAAVSFAGLLGFVGLIVPHIVRFLVGSDNRAVLPVSAVAGAAFVVGCDLVARTAFAPYEVPVGILMAFVGGPFFIYLIFRNRRGDLG